MSKRIGVLGCGWLGFPLAQQLVHEGYEVHGSSTSPDTLAHLKSCGIVPYQIVLSETGIKGDIAGLLSQIDTLIINVPPKLRGPHPESYIAKMEHLRSAILEHTVDHVLFVSSTSVYGTVEGEITEETVPEPTTASGKELLACEQLFTKNKKFKTIIIRFGGLIGPNRHPVTTLSGRDHLTGGNQYINLIHLNDCIHLISTILKEDYWGEIFNGVYPLHPKKRDYYAMEARLRQLPPPLYIEESNNQRGKVVISQNFISKLHGFHTSISSKEA